MQVGSTFKPFVLAAAMRDGVRDPRGPEVQGADARTPVSPKSVYDGDNKVKLRNYDGTIWRDKEGQEWRQRNDGNESRGRIDLREAMTFSVNTPFIQLGMDVGIDKVRDAALKAGLTDDSLARPRRPCPWALRRPAPSAWPTRTRRSPAAARLRAVLGHAGRARRLERLGAPQVE